MTNLYSFQIYVIFVFCERETVGNILFFPPVRPKAKYSYFLVYAVLSDHATKTLYSVHVLVFLHTKNI